MYYQITNFTGNSRLHIGTGRQENLREMPDSTEQSTLSHNYLQGIAEYLSARGISAGSVFSEFGIKLDELSDANKRISISQYQQMLIAAGQVADDDRVGLHVGECIKLGQYGVLGYAVMSCKNVKQAFKRHERYESLVSNRALSKYDVGLKEACLTWNTGDISVSRQMAEENVASWITFCRWITGQPICPNTVHFVHSQPDDTSEYQRIFKCPVLFDQAIVEIRFRTEFMALPIMQHDPVMQEMMDAHAERLLQTLCQGEGFLTEVRRELIVALAQETVSLEWVAEQLSLTPRTLQRRLAEFNETFKHVLDQTRKELALTYIHQPYIGLPELAYLLGYSDQPAFQRAFKKWTGASPGKFRKDNAGELKLKTVSKKN